MKLLSTKSGIAIPDYLSLMLGFGLFAIILSVVTLHTAMSADKVIYSQPAARNNKVFLPDSAPLSKMQPVNKISKIETQQPVVFLTMDDGMVKDERVIDFLKRRQWPVSVFLAHEYAKEDYDYFKRVALTDATIQNHTVSHPYLHDLTYEQQEKEICQASALTEEVFGAQPTLLRPPGGHYDANTFLAAKNCGIKAIVLWSAKVDGGKVQFQKGDKLVAGDIVLMHFRPKVMEDLIAFEREIIKRDLYVARLEDWIRIAE